MDDIELEVYVPPSVLKMQHADLVRAASLKTNRITLVVDGIVDFFNLLSILRTADYFGILNVWYITRGQVLKNHDVSTRMACGADIWLKVREFRTAEEAIEAAHQEGREIWATTLSTEAVPLTPPSSAAPSWNSDISALSGVKEATKSSLLPPKVCIVMGREADGVSEEMIKASSKQVYIPMVGFSESFNVSVATGLVLHQLFAMASDSRGDLTQQEQEELIGHWESILNDMKSRIVRKLSCRGQVGKLTASLHDGDAKDDRNINTKSSQSQHSEEKDEVPKRIIQKLVTEFVMSPRRDMELGVAAASRQAVEYAHNLEVNELQRELGNAFAKDNISDELQRVRLVMKEMQNQNCKNQLTSYSDVIYAQHLESAYLNGGILEDLKNWFGQASVAAWRQLWSIYKLVHTSTASQHFKTKKYERKEPFTLADGVISDSITSVDDLGLTEALLYCIGDSATRSEVYSNLGLKPIGESNMSMKQSGTSESNAQLELSSFIADFGTKTMYPKQSKASGQTLGESFIMPLPTLTNDWISTTADVQSLLLSAVEGPLLIKPDLAQWIVNLPCDTRGALILAQTFKKSYSMQFMAFSLLTMTICRIKVHAIEGLVRAYDESGEGGSDDDIVSRAAIASAYAGHSWLLAPSVSKGSVNKYLQMILKPRTKSNHRDDFAKTLTCKSTPNASGHNSENELRNQAKELTVNDETKQNAKRCKTDVSLQVMSSEKGINVSQNRTVSEKEARVREAHAKRCAVLADIIKCYGPNCFASPDITLPLSSAPLKFIPRLPLVEALRMKGTLSASTSEDKLQAVPYQTQIYHSVLSPAASIRDLFHCFRIVFFPAAASQAIIRCLDGCESAVALLSDSCDYSADGDNNQKTTIGSMLDFVDEDLKDICGDMKGASVSEVVSTLMVQSSDYPGFAPEKMLDPAFLSFAHALPAVQKRWREWQSAKLIELSGKDLGAGLEQHPVRRRLRLICSPSRIRQLHICSGIWTLPNSSFAFGKSNFKFSMCDESKNGLGDFVMTLRDALDFVPPGDSGVWSLLHQMHGNLTLAKARKLIELGEKCVEANEDLFRDACAITLHDLTMSQKVMSQRIVRIHSTAFSRAIASLLSLIFVPLPIVSGELDISLIKPLSVEFPDPKLKDTSEDFLVRPLIPGFTETDERIIHRMLGNDTLRLFLALINENNYEKRPREKSLGKDLSHKRANESIESTLESILSQPLPYSRWISEYIHVKPSSNKRCESSMSVDKVNEVNSGSLLLRGWSILRVLFAESAQDRDGKLPSCPTPVLSQESTEDESKAHPQTDVASGARQRTLRRKFRQFSRAGTFFCKQLEVCAVDANASMGQLLRIFRSAAINACAALRGLGMVAYPELHPELCEDVRAIVILFVICAFRGLSASKVPSHKSKGNIESYISPELAPLVQMAVFGDHGTLQEFRNPEAGFWPPCIPEDDAFLRLLATVALRPRPHSHPIEGEFAKFSVECIHANISDTILDGGAHFESVFDIVSPLDDVPGCVRQYIPTAIPLKNQ